MDECMVRIVSWNVNGLYTTLKDASNRHGSIANYFSQVLKAHILCFQEAKIQEEKLEKWMACVPGYESFWAFSKTKKGYSGVVTYVKEELSPLDAHANSLGDSDDPLLDELSNEGRMVETDHGSFVLINVYLPNAGDKEQGRPRLHFKLAFLEALKNKCDELVCSGRHVVVVGDFNVPHKDKDVYRNWNIRDLYSPEETGYMDKLFNEYVDLFRHFHPNDEDVFSVWNQKTEARIHNEGLRIDYAMCDRQFISQVVSTDVIKMFPKNWSDHASVQVTLKEQPMLSPHPSPALSSRNMKKFNEQSKQKRLTAMFLSTPKRSIEDANTNSTQDATMSCSEECKKAEDVCSISNKSSGIMLPIIPCDSEGTAPYKMQKVDSDSGIETDGAKNKQLGSQKSLTSYFRKGTG